MKLLLLTVFCLAILFSKAQNEYDSLKKYSYFIYGIVNDNKWSEATGFFIRKKNKLYLISALHVFSGRNIEHGKEKGYPNTLFLRIKTDSVNPVYFPLDISKLKDTIKDINFYANPDAYAYEIKVPKKIIIYSIEKFIKHTTCDKIINVVTCGYPVNKKTTKKSTLVASPILSEEKVFGNYCKPVYWPEENVNDSINYFISATNGIGDGSSGSPVYFVLQNKIIFGGLISIGLNENGASVVRPEKVLSVIH